MEQIETNLWPDPPNGDESTRTKASAKAPVSRAGTGGRKRLFLKKLVEFGGVINSAAEAAGISRKTHYDWLANDPVYADAFENARLDAADAIEAEVFRRAVEGVDVPVFYKGQVCGTIKQYSDVLLIAMMKALKPETYRDGVKAKIEAPQVKQYLGIDPERDV